MVFTLRGLRCEPRADSTPFPSFAITYHKKLRTRQTLYSALDKIPGIGGARKRALLRHFGSIKRIEEATVEELLKVPSMNEKIAQEILDTLRSAP